MLEIQSRIGEWAYQQIRAKNYSWNNSLLEKLHVIYFSFLEKLYPRCLNKGCTERGEPCILRAGYGVEEKDVVYWYCSKHSQRHGFCFMCGEFWGGMESFDFGNGLCPNCKDEVEEDEYDEPEWTYDL